ncbi:MAG: CoA-binding protein, partial [Gammaproteobacteria bacterium]
RFEEIEGFPVYRELKDLPQPIHTLTLYVGAAKLDSLVDEVLAAKPQRVIFNPGTESKLLQKALSEAGIDWLADCTLIMLDANKF